MDKLRIIAIYIMHRDGVPEGDLKRLYEHARLAIHEMDSINNLSFLGVDVAKVGPMYSISFSGEAVTDCSVLL